MCGRYWIDAEDAGIGGISGEIRPTDAAPVMLAEGVRTMRWGFPNPKGKGVVINARAETVWEKPMFRDAVRQRRVAVPTGGYFEWRHEGKKIREKYRFRPPDGAALYLAGIYGFFAAEDGKAEERFCILTTAANESIEPYHDRMPVTLGKDEAEAWIAGANLSDFLARTPGPLEAIPVEPEEDQQQTLF